LSALAAALRGGCRPLNIHAMSRLRTEKDMFLALCFHGFYRYDRRMSDRLHLYYSGLREGKASLLGMQIIMSTSLPSSCHLNCLWQCIFGHRRPLALQQFGTFFELLDVKDACQLLPRNAVSCWSFNTGALHYGPVRIAPLKCSSHALSLCARETSSQARVSSTSC
jgi:hypothetical protein